MLISEVVIEGIAGHPEQERLELAAYDAMGVRPGGRVTRDQLKLDLDAIYATGWFSDVRIEPVDGPLGVKLRCRWCRIRCSPRWSWSRRIPKFPPA